MVFICIRLWYILYTKSLEFELPGYNSLAYRVSVSADKRPCTWPSIVLATLGFFGDCWVCSSWPYYFNPLNGVRYNNWMEQGVALCVSRGIFSLHSMRSFQVIRETRKSVHGNKASTIYVQVRTLCPHITKLVVLVYISWRAPARMGCTSACLSE